MKLNYILLTMVLLVTCALPLVASFDLPGGAVAQSMGDAFAAVANGADSAIFNPAGMCGVKVNTLSLLYLPLHMNLGPAQLNYGRITGIYPVGTSRTVAALWNCLYSDVYRENLFLVSYAQNLGNYRVGANLKILQFTFLPQDEVASLDPLFASGKMSRFGVSGDIGTIITIDQYTDIGIVLENFACTNLAKIGKSKLPFTVKAGLGYYPGWDYTLDFDIEYTEKCIHPAFGIEKKFSNDAFAVRGGVNDRNWSLGAGVMWKNFGIDYAAIGYFHIVELGFSHQLSLNILFGR